MSTPDASDAPNDRPNKLTHSSVYSALPRDPLESEHPVQYYVDELAKAAINEMPHREIMQKSQQKSHPHDSREAQIATLVTSWFDTCVKEDDFDEDVYQKARERVMNHFVAEIADRS